METIGKVQLSRKQELLPPSCRKLHWALRRMLDEGGQIRTSSLGEDILELHLSR